MIAKLFFIALNNQTVIHGRSISILRKFLLQIKTKIFHRGKQSGYLYKIFELVPYLTNLVVRATERFKKVKAHYQALILFSTV